MPLSSDRRSLSIRVALPCAALVTLLAGTSARPVGPPAPPALNQGPMIRLEERSWDFGTATQNTLLKHDFAFRNDGTAPLLIRKVEAQCGCTVAAPQDTVLAPGSSSLIKTTLDTEANEGDIVKAIILYTNDPAEPRIDLVLHGTVRPEVRFDLRTVDFGLVHRGDTPEIVTRLITGRDAGIRILSVDGAEEWMTSKVSPVRSDTADVYEVRVRLKPDAPFGRFRQRVSLPLKNARIREESFTIKGQIYSYFRLAEEKLEFIPVRQGRKYTLSTTLDSDGGRPYRVSSASATVPWLLPSLREKGDGYVITVTLDAPGPGRYREDVILKSTDPAEPEIRLAIRVQVKD